MRLVFFIVFFYSCSILGQESLSYIENLDFDKIVLTEFEIISKASSVPSLDLNEKVVEDSKKNKERVLTKREVCKLFRKITAVEERHILDTDYDLYITFLKKDEIIQKIAISSYTKNIKIKKEYCDEDMSKSHLIAPCLYLGTMKRKLDKFVQEIAGK